MAEENGDRPVAPHDETSTARPEQTPPSRPEAEKPKGQPSSDRYESEAVIDEHSGQK